MSLILALALSAALPGGAPQVSVEPWLAYFTVRPGQDAVQEFKLVNSSTRSMKVTVTTVDMGYEKDGQRSLVAPGTSPRGLGLWLSPPPAQLQIGPGGTGSFIAVAHVPPGTKPGTYFGGYRAVVEPEETDEESARRRAITAAARIITAFGLSMHVEVTGEDGWRVPHRFDLGDAQLLAPSSARPLKLKIEVANPTLVELKITGTLAVFDEAGGVVGKAQFTELHLWPGEKRPAEATLGLPFAPGGYRATVAFEAEGGPVASRQLSFTVAPPHEGGRKAAGATPADHAH